MHPLKNDKLERLSNNELIRRIIELQNSLINISDHMELLKNRNRILDEENEKLENHIRDIVNDVKTELTQNFDKKKSPPLSYAPDIREDETPTDICNGCDNEKNVQREPCEGQTHATPDSVAPIPRDAASPRRNTPYGDTPLIEHTTNAQSGQHTNRATQNENEHKNAQTSFIKNPNQHVKMNPHKKEGQILNLPKEHTKNNIYNLLMETEKLNSIFNIASNVLNTSFFSMSKEEDGRRKGSQCVQVCPGVVDPRVLDKHTQRGDSKICKLQRNITEGISEAKNYMNFPSGNVPQEGVKLRGDVEGKENRDIIDRVEIKEEVDAKEDADIMREEVLNVEGTPIESDTKRGEDEIPIEGEHSPDDKITTPLDSNQMEENINGEKDKNDGDDQVEKNTPEEVVAIKRES
ncbi:Uncharacterized protein PCOAH_00038090 [Plasmodium coatneyi]|uniref:Uncharacterized protein n=1 Tax=Plasmodium coatneyi TaxID=208452 RepID=A0A1B1E462_9APIC|nr:Uncharacterized protein PCOAH_00038090 [Plasmodium coatneyi]ANQ09798.1 Uncharacterized protein PCOAH_00038090 [Plasmodium coatneyi]